jgi:hypothetical protein
MANEGNMSSPQRIDPPFSGCLGILILLGAAIALFVLGYFLEG